MHWIALLIAVLANALANAALKKASLRIPDGKDSTLATLLQIALDPWLWIGILLAGILLVSYLYALKGIDLSVAYPAVTGAAMVAIALIGVLLFGEAFSVMRILSMILILSGVILLRLST